MDAMFRRLRRWECITVIEVGDTVEIKDAHGKGDWRWRDNNGNVRTGIVVGMDEHCLTVERNDNGVQIRDVRDHFRVPKC